MSQEENVNSEPESASIASDLVQDNGDEFGNESDYGRDVLDEEDDDLYEDEEGEPDYDDDEDEEEPDDEESSEEENSQDSKSYREMQSMYSKTQNK